MKKTVLLPRNAPLPSAPPGLALAETVLALLKPLAEGTDLWTDSAITSNEMLARGPSFQELVLDAECAAEEGHRRFLDKHWQAAAGAEVDSTAFFVARSAEPRSLTLRTYSRLAYRAALPRFAEALDGLPVSLDEDRSWTWDHEELTPNGRPTHRTAYLLVIGLDASAPFKAKKWLRSAGKDLCHSEDARADRCVFQLGEEAGLDGGDFFSYQTTQQGFVLECESLAAAERVKRVLFGDCAAEVVAPKQKHAATVLRVALP